MVGAQYTFCKRCKRYRVKGGACTRCRSTDTERRTGADRYTDPDHSTDSEPSAPNSQSSTESERDDKPPDYSSGSESEPEPATVRTTAKEGVSKAQAKSP